MLVILVFPDLCDQRLYLIPWGHSFALSGLLPCLLTRDLSLVLLSARCALFLCTVSGKAMTQDV